LDLEGKKKISQDLHDRLSRSQIVILTDYKGLDVTSVTKLRKELTDENVEYQVVKNTLLTIASEDTDAALIKEYFKGPNAIAIGLEDPVSPARVLIKFAEENDKLEIKVGVMGDKVLGIDDIKALSKMPSREILLGQVLSAMNGVPTSLVNVLSGVPRQLMNVLHAIKEQKEAA
jgi:large subunit ribosomal protein L10